MIKNCGTTTVLSLHNIYLIVVIYFIYLFLDFYTELTPTEAKYL